MNVFRLLVGITLVALGVVFGGEAAGWWDAGVVISTWWPLIIVAAAAALWAAQPGHVLQPLVIGAIGLLLLGGTTDVLPGDPGQWIAPAVLIGIGLMVMFGVTRRGGETSDTVNGVALGAILPPPGKDASHLDAIAQKRVPLRRAGSAEIVAKNLLHLLRQDFLTGVIIPIDGGEFLR